MKSNVGMESGIHLNLFAPVVFLKFKVVALLSSAGFLDLPSFASRMKSEKKNRLAETVEPRCNDPRYNDVPGIMTIIPVI